MLASQYMGNNCGYRKAKANNPGQDGGSDAAGSSMAAKTAGHNDDDKGSQRGDDSDVAVSDVD
jgi:hypothetical protein